MILLARHGETEDNRPPLRFQGQRDTPLNDTGRRQAHALAEELAEAGIVELWTSPLSRARETAEIVGAKIGLDPTLDPRLMEGWRGRWEGLRFSDVERDEPELWARWRAAGPDFRFPEGESLREQQDRVAAAIADARRGPQPALLVCHGGCIRTVLCARDPRGLSAFHEWEVPNTAVVEA